MNAMIWLGLLSGIAFGFVIQRVGATSPDKMARAHLMLEGDIPRFMLMAVAFSAVGLVGLQAVGEVRTIIIPTSLVATIVGGILFGLGWGLSGYCPGTTWAAAGEGRLDAVAALLGGLVGTAVFAHFHEQLIPLLHASGNVGQITLADWFGSRALGVAVLVVGFGILIWIVGILWGRGSNVSS
ncbi:MAG: YeeE/YedE thiosulfate transporter family protein [Desulfosudaceae bacterium]